MKYSRYLTLIFRFVVLIIIIIYSYSDVAALEYPSISVMFAGNKVDNTKPTATELSRYDIIVNMALPSELLNEAKGLNPNLHLLRTSQGPYVNLTGYGKEIFDAEINGKKFQENFLLHSFGGIIPEKRIRWWDNNIAFYNFVSEEAVKWLSDYVISIYKESLKSYPYDGIYLDGLHYEIWDFIKNKDVKNTEVAQEPDIDANGDGIIDSQKWFDDAWKKGIDQFLKKIRNSYPDIEIVANDIPNHFETYKDYINGGYFENDISYWLDGETWFDPKRDIIDLGNKWVTEAKEPRLSIAGLGGAKSLTESKSFQNHYTPWDKKNIDTWKSFSNSKFENLSCFRDFELFEHKAHQVLPAIKEKEFC